MGLLIAKRLKNRRLHINMSQKTLSERSGVSLSTLKKFEYTGKISLESLLKLAIILEIFEDFQNLFVSKLEEVPATLDEILIDKSRKRGRQ
ncbi:MAG: helix-turn-helix transcriptional regulator [Candidatus Algichlamydia australiensis]|nr:helix-turn-helix transcriptional regulator [Chlamydiales bacterium]